MEDRSIQTRKGVVFVRRIGAETQENVFETHCHLTYEMIYILNGAVDYCSEDTEQMLTAGQLLFIPPLVYHSLSSENPGEYNRIMIQFDSSSIPEEIQSVVTEQRKNRIFDVDPTRQFIAQEMERCFTSENPARYAPLAEALLIQLLYGLPWNETSITSTEQMMDRNLFKVMRYINMHLTDKLSLDEIAQNTFLSVSTISHLFKEKLNTSAKRYILRKKFTYAKQLILDGYTASEAAKEIGYMNYANFYTMYKKVLGETPSESKRMDSYFPVNRDICD